MRSNQTHLNGITCIGALYEYVACSLCSTCSYLQSSSTGVRQTWRISCKLMKSNGLNTHARIYAPRTLDKLRYIINMQCILRVQLHRAYKPRRRMHLHSIIVYPRDWWSCVPKLSARLTAQLSPENVGRKWKEASRCLVLCASVQCRVSRVVHAADIARTIAIAHD